jgi:hypothetical protein
VVQIVSAITIGIVSIVAAIIAARYTEKYRDRSENAAEHYKQIKVNVLNPMLKLTDRYYLPIVELRKENLQWFRRDTKQFAAGLDEEPIIYEVVASIIPPNTSDSTVLQGNEEAQIDNELYEDCKKNHFKLLFEEWETLTSRVNQFNQESLQLANMITHSIAKTLDLPVAKIWDAPGRFVTPYCGIAILNRMAGIGIYQIMSGFQSTTGGQYLQVSFGNVIIQLEPSADIQKIRGIIDEEIKVRRKKFLELKTLAGSIDKDFVLFRPKLQTIAEKQKLSGKCSYI